MGGHLRSRQHHSSSTCPTRLSLPPFYLLATPPLSLPHPRSPNSPQHPPPSAPLTSSYRPLLALPPFGNFGPPRHLGALPYLSNSPSSSERVLASLPHLTPPPSTCNRSPYTSSLYPAGLRPGSLFIICLLNSTQGKQGPYHQRERGYGAASKAAGNNV